ncbi:MAG TPA: TetR/AcrR family transcriptional regulator [Ktedonobacteraceae bacterium]|jgi:AcrR family transcriptional regulator|nr:TetR/AcrR family transcriptional regulator [Ktedonobacteraceae bacterium]
MAHARRERQHAAIREEIKETARKLMEEHGTGGITTRSIAREMGLTAPALYHYFASRDELITALIVDAFNALADTLQEVSEQAEGEGTGEQLRKVLLAYRQWALAHPADFQLIYGNPIPGYEAPREVTVPAAVRGFRVLVPLVEQLLGKNHGHSSSDGSSIIPEAHAFLSEQITREGYPVSPEALYLTIVGWTRIHGIIMLELFNHLQPTIGDVDAFYRSEIDILLKSIGYSESDRTGGGGKHL